MAHDGANLPLILFDATCLISMANRPSPAGLPRLEIQYALFLRRKFGSSVQFVAQTGPTLTLVPEDLIESLLSYIVEVWQGRASERIDFSERFRTYGIRIPPEKKHKEKKPVAAQQGGRIKHLSGVRILRLTKRGLFKILPRLKRATTGCLKEPLALAAQSHPAQGSFQTAALQAANERSCLSSTLKQFLDCDKSHRRTYVNVAHRLVNARLFLELRTRYKFNFVTYIHDLIPLDYPEYFKPGHDKTHETRLRNALDVSSSILCNSNYTAKRVFDTAISMGYKSPQVSVACIGHQNFQLRVPELAFERPHFVIVGTIEGRKNHLSLLHIWRKLAQRDRNPPLLFIIGKRGWSNGSVLDMLDRCSAIRPHVVELNGLSDQEMYGLLEGARALLLPSFAEGWGMPIVEALSFGVPVICSDIPVFHEASQECADFIDPCDLPAWETAILEYANPASKRRNTYLEALKGFRPPNWEDSFKVLERAIRGELPARSTMVANVLSQISESQAGFEDSDAVDVAHSTPSEEARLVPQRALALKPEVAQKLHHLRRL